MGLAEEMDPQLDPEVEARLLGALARLRPDDDPDPTDSPAMPPAVWARMEQAIAHESGRRMGTVVELAPRRRTLRWVGPLVAVSAVVLGVVVVTNQSSETGDVIASDTSMVAEAPAADAAVAKAAPEAIVQAGFVPPAMTVVDSTQDFTPATLKAGVTSVLEQLGVTTMSDMATMTPSPITPPADEAVLRECVTEITDSPTSQALIVIRASYDGAEAGVVVVPAVMMGDVATVDRAQISDPTVHIFVVGPRCGTQPAQVISHVLHAIGQ